MRQWIEPDLSESRVILKGPLHAFDAHAVRPDSIEAVFQPCHCGFIGWNRPGEFRLCLVEVQGIPEGQESQYQWQGNPPDAIRHCRSAEGQDHQQRQHRSHDSPGCWPGYITQSHQHAQQDEPGHQGPVWRGKHRNDNGCQQQWQQRRKQPESEDTPESKTPVNWLMTQGIQHGLQSRRIRDLWIDKKPVLQQQDIVQAIAMLCQ